MSSLTQFIPRSLRQTGGRWLRRRWADVVFFERRARRATPVLVYQMGKVGSSSLYGSLLRQYSGPVGHAHLFSAEDGEDLLIRRFHRWAISDAKPLNVISLTRDPIRRNISAFFQNFEIETGVPFAQSSFSLEELKAIFLEKYAHDPLQWFDRNIRQQLGIDVLETPFPDSGVQDYQVENVRLLVLRSELSNDVKEDAVARFLKLERFEIRNENVGEKKDYSATYREFKNTVKLPGEYVERMCRSNFFRHFYDESTIEQARRKWTASQD